MRRLPLRTVLILSIVMAVLCLAGGVWLLATRSYITGGILIALGAWFCVDAYRAWRWAREPKQ